MTVPILLIIFYLFVSQSFKILRSKFFHPYLTLSTATVQLQSWQRTSNIQLNAFPKVFSFFFCVCLEGSEQNNKIRYFLLPPLFTYTCAAYNERTSQCWNQYKWNSIKYFNYMILFLHFHKLNTVTGISTNLLEGSKNRASVVYSYYQGIFWTLSRTIFFIDRIKMAFVK